MRKPRFHLPIVAILLLFVVGHALAEPASMNPWPVVEEGRVLGSWMEARALLARQSPSLKRQLAAVGRARANVELALSRLLPEVSLGVGTDYALVRPSAEQAPAEGQEPGRLVLVHELLSARSLVPRATATFSITFSIADLVAHESARTGFDAERQTLVATRHGLVASLAATLLGVVGAERVAARNLAGLEAARERMRLTERLVELGRATELDVSRISQDLNEAEANAVSAAEALAQLRDELGRALGLPYAIRLADDFDVRTLLSPRTSGCQPLASFDRRPELVAARGRQQQASLAARAADLAYLPEIRLGSQYSATYAPTSAVTFDGERGVLHTWLASLDLVWTAYDGGARASAGALAEADLKASEADREQATAAAAVDYRGAQRLVKVARRQTAIARRDLEAAEQLDRLSRRALELGTASALEVVDAARRLRTAEINLAVREVELTSARVRTHMAKAVCR